jgi:hypothetical protein
MVAEKHDGLWQNNQLCINMLHGYIGAGYPPILLTGLKKEPFDWQHFAVVANELGNLHKWQDEEGNLYENDKIAWDLVELIQKGDLRTYRSKDPTAPAVTVKELQGVNLTRKTSEYFIDRDDLGCFLAGRGHTLPRFWYEAEDRTIYRSQLEQRAESVNDLREHLKAVVAENESLKRQLLNARPFMDPEHPHFAPELEAGVQLWLDSFGDKPADAPVAKKPTMANWLKLHRSEAITTKDGKPSDNAIERIVMVANPRKEGGRPRKSKIS